MSLSDIEGDNRFLVGSLQLLEEYGYPPIVSTTENGGLHWKGGETGSDYILVINGDLEADGRGNNPGEVIANIQNLIAQAPEGHVLITVGNHDWDGIVSGYGLDDESKHFPSTWVENGIMRAAIKPFYNYIYVHSCQISLDLQDIDDANLLLKEINGSDISNFNIVDESLSRGQKIAMEHFRDLEDRKQLMKLLGVGTDGRGRNVYSGMTWMRPDVLTNLDIEVDTPPKQIIGHTGVGYPTKFGNLIMENTRAKNEGANCSIVIETPEKLFSIDDNRGVVELD